MMVAGHHLIWTAYGCWLPNDPRGSSSHEIRADAIADLGELHHGRKKQQPPSREIRAFYEEADTVLQHPRLLLTDDDILLVGGSFAETVRRHRYSCYACSVMTDHVHLLIRKHRDRAEEMIAAFQEESKQFLIERERRPADHPVWGGPGWKVFQYTREDMRRIERYIFNNPVKAGRPSQRWEFVQKYDGWLPGEAKRS